MLSSACWPAWESGSVSSPRRARESRSARRLAPERLLASTRKIDDLSLRRLGAHDRLEPSAPGFEGRPLLRIVGMTVVDGRHVALGVVQDLLDRQPGDPHAGHEGGRRSPEVVESQVGYLRALAEAFRRLLRVLDRVVRRRRREHPGAMCAVTPSLENRESLRTEGHAV